jgi:hypothetical protein
MRKGLIVGLVAIACSVVACHSQRSIYMDARKDRSPAPPPGEKVAKPREQATPAVTADPHRRPGR